jgi:magnesium transporter
LITIFVHRGGATERATSIDRAWLAPGSGAFVWVDLAGPSPLETLVLSETFAFHPLSVEDAKAELHYPKIEAYDGYLYAILHGVDEESGSHRLITRDIDFFVGAAYLVTVHDGRSRSVRGLQDLVARNPRIMSEGPIALFHRIVDAMVAHYRPALDEIESRLNALEEAVLERPHQRLSRQILKAKRQVSDLRRILAPQRDVIGRLARRDYVDISTDMSFRFRDVHDQIVRLADDTMIFHDRVTAILDAHLTSASHRLNEVMKVLTVVATLFMPLTVLTGLWGMNVRLPPMPGGDGAQFWWIVGVMTAIVVLMLGVFRRKRWL